MVTDRIRAGTASLRLVNDPESPIQAVFNETIPGFTEHLPWPLSIELEFEGPRQRPQQTCVWVAARTKFGAVSNGLPR